MRLFIAIPVADPVRLAVAAFQHELAALCPKSEVKWTRPEQLHLTLEFLGEVPADQLAPLEKAMRAVCEPCVGFPLRVGGAGAFPSASRPRVLWLGLESPGRGLFVLQERLRSAVAPFAQSPEDRPFSPHLTLGRVKRLFPIEAEAIHHRMASPPRSAWELWTVRSVHLMQSHLESQGSVHQCLCAVDLLGGVHSETAGRLNEVIP